MYVPDAFREWGETLYESPRMQIHTRLFGPVCVSFLKRDVPFKNTNTVHSNKLAPTSFGRQS